MSQNKASLKLYNPSEYSEEELINNFVIRVKQYNIIMNELEGETLDIFPQNWIIKAQRGNGKTTLLRRVYYEVLRHEEISKRTIPIIFNEEEYQIKALYKFWIEIAKYLENFDDKFEKILDEMETIKKLKENENLFYEVLNKVIKKEGKRIILFVDNIDLIFKSLENNEMQRLREVLISNNKIQIIGASSEVLEYNYDYNKPLYEHFRILEIGELTGNETIQLLMHLSEKYSNNDVVKKITTETPERIETLRRLTGGILRTIILLFEIFNEYENGNVFNDLELIVDGVTPLYKHRMEQLSDVHQEIIDVMAKKWDGMASREIAEEMGMESKNISAQIKILEKNNIVISESIGKNKIYLIKERFFNIWYIMRFGRKKDKEKVKWITKFLEVWCQRDELNTRAFRHIEAVKKGFYNEKGATQYTNELNMHQDAHILLWNDKIEESLEIFKKNIMIEEKYEEIEEYILLLISKKMYNIALGLFQDEKMNLIEKYKPIYFALKILMEGGESEYAKRAGSELKETIQEILEEIERLSKTYK